MINSWKDLIDAIVVWFDTPLKFKKKEVEPIEDKQKCIEDLLRPRVFNLNERSQEIYNAMQRHQTMIDPWVDQLTPNEKKDYAATWGDTLKRDAFIKKLRAKYGFNK